ncbi:MAG: histidine kinase, partial [Ignavibacteria bacterium]
MRFRITNILLVSSLYDNYLFEEDGRLYELIRKEYLGLNLSHAPEITQVSNTREAIQKLNSGMQFQLILVTMHIEDSTAVEFAQELKAEGIDIPIVLIGFYNKALAAILNSNQKSVFDKVFVWTGDYRLIIGIIKYIEDRKNLENDVNNIGVQIILVIEDDIRYYSAFMPMIYTELFKQSQSLLDETVNLSHRYLRMRARPKIILCSDYESAENFYNQYKEYIQGIITDVEFPRNGKMDPKAGIRFAKKIKDEFIDIPVVIQSNVPDNEEVAYSIGASFLLKESPTLLHDLNKFMREQFSFGDFIFRNEQGHEVARAKNLYDLEKKIKTIPLESLIYHASRNHFSNWLKARTEFYLAHKLRPKKVSDFKDPEELRNLLIETVAEFRINRQRAVINDFNKETFDFTATFTRIGGGSIGGKARGLAFINYLIHTLELRNKFDDVEIAIPSLLVIGTEVFDEFIEKNNLYDFAIRSDNDEQINEKFRAAQYFPQEIIDALYEFLSIVNTPIAVRSSS